MLAYFLLYARVAIALAGLRRTIRILKNERAVQAWRRGDAAALTRRPVDLTRHLAERRALISTFLSFTAFIFALLSGGMRWPGLLTLVLIVLAVGLFVLAVVQSPAERTEMSAIRPVPRNALCPCGSGKKYKHCHGDPTVSAA